MRARAREIARVYLARGLKHDRSVALKVLHPDLAATVGSNYLLREVRNADDTVQGGGYRA